MVLLLLSQDLAVVPVCRSILFSAFFVVFSTNMLPLLFTAIFVGKGYLYVIILFNFKFNENEKLPN